MAGMTFDFDWLDAAPSPDHVSRATMAELEIRIDADSVTAILDRRSRSYRNRLVVPLFPLAEWFVANWWFLWNEADVENPVLRRPGFIERHDLRHAANGFFFPSVLIASVGDRVRVSAEAWRPTRGHIEFLTTQTRTTDRASLETAFRSIIDAVIERLAAYRTRSRALERDWEAINRVDDDERAFCQASALLGVDPFEVEESTASMIARLWDGTPSSLRQDLFACAEVSGAAALASWIERGVVQLDTIPSGERWTELRQNVGQPSGTVPWERGYDLARRARRHMRLDGAPVAFDGPWSIGSQEVVMPSERLDAIVGGGAPSCLVSGRSDVGRRFLLARAVGEFLARAGDEPSLLTWVSTDRQAQTRSFAAEFLAPSAVLSAELGPSREFIDADTVERLANKFHVAARVIHHQITNHNLGRIIDVM